MRALGHFVFYAVILGLGGCSGGGGGSASQTPVTSVPNNGSGAPSVTPPATITINAAGAISMGPNAPLLATGTTANFLTSPPALGAELPVNQTVLTITPTSVSDANAGGGVLTSFQPGTVISGNGIPTVELKIPSLSLDLSNLSGRGFVTGPGNNPTAFSNLNYLVMGVWSNVGASNPAGYGGALVAGYQTPTTAVPTSGKAIYTAQYGSAVGSVSGIIYAPSDHGTIDSGRITGAAEIRVDFSTRAVDGILTGMQSPHGSSWNGVNLSGTLTGSQLSGTTTAGGTPLDPEFNMATSANGGRPATGTFNGALYGPNGQEMGLVWTLHDDTKTVIGTVAAVKEP